MATNRQQSTDRQTAVESILDDIERMVLEDLEPLEQLPSEAELAAKYGVSRLTVREALKVLSGRQLIEINQGRRPIVAEPSSALLGSYFAAAIRRDPGVLLELAEVRLALETHIATLAARRASSAAIAALEAALDAMRATAEVDPEAFHDADVRFHEALALASGNHMLSFLIEALRGPMRRSFTTSLGGAKLRYHDQRDPIAAHEAILDRIRARDARGAAAATRAHLRQAQLDLRAAQRRMAAEPTPVDLNPPAADQKPTS